MKALLLPEAEMSAFQKQTLRNQLDIFYQQVTNYTAFETISHQILCWEKIENDIRHTINNIVNPIRILEVGAGRSGFNEFLKEKGLRNKVHYSAQDVTTQNATWLESQTDEVFYGDVRDISDRQGFDVIFSTYVLEHVTNPASHLEQLYRLLNSGGGLFIFCPRYDVPGYFCPSSRHLGWGTRLEFGIRWSLARIGSLLSRRPAFLIQTDLAAFHKPFFIDADAVHWVSLLDLKLWSKSKNTVLKQFTVGEPPFGSKDWVVKRLLTCAVKIYKPNA